MSIVKKFDFGNLNVTIVKESDDTWFKGKDVALALGYAKPRRALELHVDDKYKAVREGLNRSPNLGHLHPHTTFIKEPGLYSLVFRSKLQTAKVFQNWVFSKVLPSIRKTGAYQLPEVKGDQLMLMNERDLHHQVIRYIHKYHPSAIIVPGLGELQDTTSKRIIGYKKGYKGVQSDIIILNKTRKHNGLVIELKTPNLTRKLSDKQAECLDNLFDVGYKTIVSCNYDETHRSIDEYFKNVRIDCLKCCKKFRSRETLKTHQKWFHKT